VRALLVSLGADSYAIEMACAREVAVLPALTRLPDAPPSVLGVFNLRGEIVPVFDTARLLGVGTTSGASHVAIVETGLGPAGLSMTSMGESVELGEHLGPTETPGTGGSYALAVSGGARRLTVLLDIDALLAPARLAV
jgi:purine-binding chemotaxis protein CheW